MLQWVKLTGSFNQSICGNLNLIETVIFNIFVGRHFHGFKGLDWSFLGGSNERTCALLACGLWPNRLLSALGAWLFYAGQKTSWIFWEDRLLSTRATLRERHTMVASLVILAHCCSSLTISCLVLWFPFVRAGVARARTRSLFQIWMAAYVRHWFVSFRVYMFLEAIRNFQSI